MKGRNETIDFFRYIASFLVISIHANLGVEFSGFPWLLIQTISRTSVPFFCMVTGYYYYKRINSLNMQAAFDYTVRYIKQLIYIYIYIYIFVSIPYFMIKIIQVERITTEVFLQILKELLFTGIWGHLWYFPAVIISIIILYYLKCKFRLNKTIFLFSLLLYLFMCLGDVYYGFIKQFGYLDMVFNSSWYISFFRGLGYAFCYINLGGMTENIKCKWNFSKRKAILVFLVLMGALLAEETITYYLQWNTKLTLAFFYCPLMFAFMYWVLEDPLKKYMHHDTFDYRGAANLTYYFHPLLLAVESKIINNSFLLWGITVLIFLIGNYFGQHYTPKIFRYITR